MIRKILLLGDPRLYQVSEPVEREELEEMRALTADLRDTVEEYRRVHGAGRAIAAPQVGVGKRLLVRSIAGETTAFVNPVVSFPDGETMEVLDDCMSFPGLLVRLHRFRRCTVVYRDLDWRECREELEGDLAELMQHEYDHLDGILAVMRADDSRSLVYRRRGE
ncbi:MAG: peptide deformylase [Oscillibacter sp.]|jgi:peptide deformylase|nr:peptide deformylase [Oscillibacter sp.]